MCEICDNSSEDTEEETPPTVACSDCGDSFPEESSELNNCSACDNPTCSDCLHPNMLGGESLCETCIEGRCARCSTRGRDRFLSDCCHCESSYCNDCSFEGYCSESCYEEATAEPDEDEDEDATSSGAVCLYECTQRPRIWDYSTKAKWRLVKQPWENTVYMGIELEMEFPYENQAQVFSETAKHLPNMHLWKRDGSIQNHGAELVTTPMTLQSLHKVNFTEYFKALNKLGARSFEAQTCGLHVHVNRDSITELDLMKLQWFMSLNRAFLVKFSQRKEQALSSYCQIPEINQADEYDSFTGRYKKNPLSGWRRYGRFCALNTQNRETIEFRFFRGTLNYDRFRASLEFVPAIIAFVKCHGMAACKGADSLAHFGEFVKRSKEYRVLYRYLESKKLLEIYSSKTKKLPTFRTAPMRHTAVLNNEMPEWVCVNGRNEAIEVGDNYLTSHIMTVPAVVPGQIEA